MTSIPAIREGIAACLANIDGLRIHATIPGTVDPPAAVIHPASDGTFLTYGRTMDGAEDVTIAVLLVVGAGDDRSAQEELDAYLADTGPLSIKAAVDADSDLGGAAHFAAVTEARNYGLKTYGDVTYWGCEFLITVGAM